MLTDETQVLCTGAYVRGHPEHLFLNDATGEDGAGEYAVIAGGLGGTSHRQVESITFSWCTYDRALMHIQKAIAGEYDGTDLAVALVLRLEKPQQHGFCRWCR